MIINSHPILKALDDSQWKAHLIGSRYVGVFDRDKSDYDFLVEAKDYDDWNNLKRWLEENNFKVNGLEGYGPDNRLYGSNVWTWDLEHTYAPVDILPVKPAEAKMRIAFFAEMKRLGDTRGGLLAKTLKQDKGWSTLWDCLDSVLRLYSNQDWRG